MNGNNVIEEVIELDNKNCVEISQYQMNRKLYYKTHYTNKYIG